ncbi:hypothetical protein Tco_1313050 [Tanacetum coccineum]
MQQKDSKNSFGNDESIKKNEKERKKDNKQESNKVDHLVIKRKESSSKKNEKERKKVPTKKENESSKSKRMKDEE